MVFRCFPWLTLPFGATIFGYGAWSYLLFRHPANSVAPWSLLVPVAGLIPARIVLDERLSAIQWTGCLLVVSGLLAAFSSFAPWRTAARSLPKR